MKPDELEIEVPLKDETTGLLKFQLKQFGMNGSDELVLQTYAEAAELEQFEDQRRRPTGCADRTPPG